MRFPLFLLILMGLSQTLLSQTIVGIVTDESKQPLPGASVYLDGTSVGTITLADGSFTLTASQKINTSLIVSMIGFETITIPDPFSNPKYLVVMTEKTETLTTVVVENDGFTRKEKLKAFLREFLGETRGGRSCTIHNLDDISLRFNKKTNRLVATADKPLQITNAYLGYEINFSLVEFFVDFRTRSLKKDDVVRSMFAGTSSYAAVTSDPQRYEKHRKESFSGSSKQLLTDLCRGNWTRKGFMLYRGKTPVDANEHLLVENSDNGFTVKLLFPEIEKALLIKQTQGGTGKIKKTLPQSYNLLFRNKDISGVKFHKEQFGVDAFGNLESPYDLEFWGEMSRLRVGDLLPLDYLPPKEPTQP